MHSEGSFSQGNVEYGKLWLGEGDVWMQCSEVDLQAFTDSNIAAQI
jgi:hypothetical protein